MNKDVFDKFTKNARTVLIEAERISELLGESLSSQHILLAIIKIPGTLSRDILNEYSVTAEQIELLSSIETPGERRRKTSINDESRKLISEAFKLASSFGHYNVDTEHLLLAIVTEPSFKAYGLILKTGVDPETIKDQLFNIFRDLQEMDNIIKEQAISRFQSAEKENEGLPGPEMISERVMPSSTGLQTPPKKQNILDYFAVNLVEKASKGEIDPVYGRDLEIQRAVRILLRRTKNNPIFIGESGVGKTAIVEGLARRIASEDVPEPLRNKKILQLDLGLLVAGTMYRGQFEERLKKVISEVVQDKNIVLFIDEIHSIVGTGSAEGSMDAANLLKPALAKGEIRLIGATTIDEYRKFIEKDPALERRLQSVSVKEPSQDEAIKILKEIRPLYEKHHRVKISDDAIEASVGLSSKYQRERFLPDKAIDLIDEASAEKSMQNNNSSALKKLKDIRNEIEKNIALKERLITEEKFEEAARVKDDEVRLKRKEARFADDMSRAIKVSTISEKDIANIISQITGIPIGNIALDEMKRLANIETVLSKYIAGQDEAIIEIAKSIRRNRSGIRDQNKPIGSFIFLGPSGVGKTEVARVLAEHCYNDKKSLVKIDMSEFMEKHTVSALTGAPPGYIGYDEAGRLTEKVRRNPYSIVLFDEIEKAHPEVFNILLQILDEGVLTDSKGRVIDFKNTIIIMTSNIGLEEYKSIKKIGFEHEAALSKNETPLKEILSERLFDVFRPEMINRIDKIIVFNTLNQADLLKIAKIQLDRLKKRLLEKDITMAYHTNVPENLIKSCTDPTFGARPIIREIAETIESQIGDKLIKSQIRSGDKIFIKNCNGKIKLTKTGKRSAK